MHRLFTLLAILAVASALLAACAQTPATSNPTQEPQIVEVTRMVQGTPMVETVVVTVPAPEPTQGPQVGSVQMNGAGATFPFPLYSRWFYEYAFVDPSVKFNYQSIGSGGGIRQITEKTVDFAGSDAILNEDQFAAAPGIQMLPSVAGADVPTYNVAELADADPLVLDADTLSSIFLGKITKWNDPAIAALNPNLTLPDKDIIVVHRSDGSGTTFIFTDYLSTVSEEWNNTVGKGTSVEWPVGLGGKGNEGVAGTVSQNDGSIGYVELAYAKQNNLAIAKLVNAAGTTVEASPETTQNAMADFGGEMPDTLARSIVNAPGENSWPIAGYTYLLVYMDQTDCTKANKLVEFIRWALTDGSPYAQELEYVPLPDNVREQVFSRLDQMTCNGQPLGQ
ncbi:MAG TPA: phosphate ABC transporter substrate-binding protein PstS [Anaerolineales bacterium]|nr:phosphate ABC transporter substrate-binding protein PstS [Anaerolineales bacterium]